jgi:hypothetical protein
LVVQGADLRDLASELAQQQSMDRLSLQVQASSAESLQVEGIPSAVSSRDVVRIARRTGAKITRLFVEGVGATAMQYSETQVMRPSAVQPSAPRDARTGFGLAYASIVANCILRHFGRRLVTPFALAVLLIGPVVAGVYAWLNRGAAGAWAIYDCLVFVTLVLSPLWAQIISRALCSRASVDSSVERLARYGAHRRVLAAMQLASVTCVSAVMAAVSAMLSVAIVGNTWAAIGSDMWVSVWIAGLSGAVYGAIAVALTIAFRSVLASWAFLLLDWLLGGTPRLGSALFPRAHVHNLLGSPRAIELSQFASCAILAALLFLALGLATFRTDA